MSTEHPTPSSRRWLLGGAAAVAGAAGLGLGWWRFRAQEAGPVPAGFWSRQFTTPAGASLALGPLRGKPLLINFWATWCAPCVEEMPLLDAFYRQNAVNGWQIIGLAIDQPSAVRSFLQRVPVTFPIGLAGLEGTELGRDLGNSVGGLPFTVVLRADGGIHERKMGKVSAEELSRWKSALSG